VIIHDDPTAPAATWGDFHAMLGAISTEDGKVGCVNSLLPFRLSLRGLQVSCPSQGPSVAFASRASLRD